MATRRAAGGIAHPTVVPENFEPDDGDESEDVRDADEGDDTADDEA